jgi:large subunit ribosomal protein L23
MGIFKSTKTEDKEKSVKKSATKEKKAVAAKSVSMKEMYSEKTDSKAIEKGKTEQLTPNRGQAYKTLVKPLITEKAATLGSLDKYAFAVSDKSNKIEVADAIKEVYGVKPVAVNIIAVKGKKVRYGRTMGKRKDWKKAIVTLPKGKTINIYEGV